MTKHVDATLLGTSAERGKKKKKKPSSPPAHLSLLKRRKNALSLGGKILPALNFESNLFIANPFIIFLVE